MVAPRRAAHAEESAEVEVLFANLEKLNTLTRKIQGSLNRLESSGKNVQAAIGPVYGNTRVLQTTHRSTRSGALWDLTDDYRYRSLNRSYRTVSPTFRSTRRRGENNSSRSSQGWTFRIHFVVG